MKKVNRCDTIVKNGNVDNGSKNNEPAKPCIKSCRSKQTDVENIEAKEIETKVLNCF